MSLAKEVSQEAWGRVTATAYSRILMLPNSIAAFKLLKTTVESTKISAEVNGRLSNSPV